MQKDHSALRGPELPASIRRLAKRQPVRLRHRDAPRDLTHIIDIVQNILAVGPPATGHRNGTVNG